MDEQSEPPTFSILAVGAIYQDVILTVPHFPHEDEKLAATTRVVRVGGNIPNTLAVLAQVLPRWASVVFASVVAGEEGVWRPMIEELEELGGQNENGGGNVRVLFEVRDGKKDMMPTAYILESQQTRSRSIISHNQIRELSTEAVLSLLWTYSLQPSHLAADYDELLATWYNNGGTYVPDWIHFEGRNTETVMGLIKHYRKNKNVVRLVVSVEFEKYGREGLSALVEECDVAFFAETWAREEVARSREGMMEDDRSEIAGREAMDVDAFFEVITPRLRGGAVAFLMVGELGAYVFHQSVDKMWVSTHIPAISILPDEIVETTGAGDTFIAAAIYALGITGLDAVRACKLAVRVSGMKCSVQGFGGLERAFSEAGQRSSIVDGRERSVGVDVESRRREVVKNDHDAFDSNFQALLMNYTMNPCDKTLQMLARSNTTVFPSSIETSYWGHYDHIGNLNLHLSIAEKAWAAWYAYMQNDVLATGIMSFVMHEAVYFGRALPWVLIDAIPYFRKWKLQDSKVPTAAEQWRCTKLVLITHFTIELPQIWVFHPLAHYFGLSIDVPFPTMLTMAYQLAIFFVLEDTWHYWFHRLFHWGPFYKYIHKIHHEYSAPFGLAAEYASPIEVVFLGIGTVGSPILYSAFTGNIHLLTMYVWICLRLFQAIDAHSGYDFPWSLHHLLPFWAGASYHDVHHEKFIGNYSSSFRWWDWVFDTQAGPEAMKKRRDKKRAERDQRVIMEQAELSKRSSMGEGLFVMKSVCDEE